MKLTSIMSSPASLTTKAEAVAAARFTDAMPEDTQAQRTKSCLRPPRPRRSASGRRR